MVFLKISDLHIVQRILASAIAYLFFKTLAEKEDKRNQIFDAFIVLGLIEVLFVLAESLKLFSFFPSSIYLVNGSLGNPNVVAIFLSTLIPLSFYKFCSVLRFKCIYIVIILLFVLVIIFSKCRSAIVFLIFTTVAYAVRCNPKWNLKRLMFSGMIIVGFMLAFVLVNTHKKDSNTSRVLIWKVSLDMIKDKPVTGFGFTNFEKEYNLYQSNYLKKKERTQEEVYTSGYIRQPYNEFIYYWLTGGLIYLILYLILFGMSGYIMVISFVKDCSLLRFTSSVVLVGIFLISAFSYTFYLVIIEFFLYAHLGILSAFTSPIKTVNLNKSTLFFFLMIPILVFGNQSIKEMKSDYQISNSIFNKTTPLSKTLQTFKTYDRFNKENPQFLFNYALSLMKSKQFEEAIKKLNTAKKYSSYYQIYYVCGICYELTGKTDEAEQEYLYSSALYPSKYQPQYALFKLYQRLNMPQKAKAIAQKIDQMPTRVNSKEVNIIRSEIKKYLSQ